LLRFRVDSDGPFRITLKKRDGSANSLCEVGELLNRDNSKKACDTLEVEPETVELEPGTKEKFVFAAYRAPINFPIANESSPVPITLEATTATGDVLAVRSLVLHRPPVVLTHGVWSSPSIWRGEGGGENFKKSLQADGFRVSLTDHQSIDGSAGSFDPKKEPPALKRLVDKISNTKSEMRIGGIAVSQVDAVGHSMGGLMTRAIVKLPNYKRLDNYAKGDLHKIITIGTPHFGTSLANLLLEKQCNLLLDLHIPRPRQVKVLVCSPKEGFCNEGNSIEFETFTLTLKDFFKKFLKRPIGPAVVGLQTNSDALKNIGKTTTIPSHPIVGIAPHNSVTEVGLNSILKLFGIDKNIDAIFKGSLHDVIVPRESQLGGIFTTSATLRFDIVHADFSFGVGEPVEP